MYELRGENKQVIEVVTKLIIKLELSSLTDILIDTLTAIAILLFPIRLEVKVKSLLCPF